MQNKDSLTCPCKDQLTDIVYWLSNLMGICVSLHSIFSDVVDFGTEVEVYRKHVKDFYKQNLRGTDIDVYHRELYDILKMCERSILSVHDCIRTYKRFIKNVLLMSENLHLLLSET